MKSNINANEPEAPNTVTIEPRTRKRCNTILPIPKRTLVTTPPDKAIFQGTEALGSTLKTNENQRVTTMNANRK